MAESTSSKLQRLVLSSSDLRAFHPEWSSAMIEDYLNIWDDLVTLSNRIDDVASQTTNVTRVTAADSPYSIESADGTIFCNTSDDNITVVLPVGIEGEPHRIVNTGEAGNTVTIQASTGDYVNGSTEDEILYDGESFELQFNSYDGWF
ncbi:MAG: hypothetical protein KJP07_13580 [Desulfatitalea sp.]|nr:hypothetical protein [Desulfatitalea sp.]